MHTYRGSHTKEDIEAVHLNIGLGINGVRETSELRDPAKIRNEVFTDFPSTSSLTDVFELLSVD